MPTGEGCYLQDGLLHHHVGEGRAEQLVLTRQLREQVLALGGSIPWTGHLSRPKSYERTEARFYWQALHSEMDAYCKSCPEHQLTSSRTTGPYPLSPIHLNCNGYCWTPWGTSDRIQMHFSSVGLCYLILGRSLPIPLHWSFYILFSNSHRLKRACLCMKASTINLTDLAVFSHHGDNKPQIYIIILHNSVTVVVCQLARCQLFWEKRHEVNWREGRGYRG